MSDKSLKLKISIPPVEGIEDIPIVAVELLAQKMGFDANRVQDIVQALTEACVNSILYSTTDDDIEVLVTALHGSLVLEVRDHGPGFNPDAVPSPDFDLISQIGVKNGGFGIHMIKSLVDKVEIESSEAGTTIRMSTFLKNSDLNPVAS
ncbi:anti-sigma regulatory factor (Ser/Thr protein kinase) [Synechococcus sp. PCC 7502]|uniref:ATP-binding protein n=1 Tax=Synechococcus sp. PCC 7502 TaxID=1173263 RepID=UPI00029FCA8F|nr:ATP-binding protein [Synechococcus sp. PCC 7502]AFY75234.1 anti-sigma regulatory factor (Ser/Thr protein kinase) [Synechococcus sp. PCC 7502]